MGVDSRSVVFGTKLPAFSFALVKRSTSTPEASPGAGAGSSGGDIDINAWCMLEFGYIYISFASAHIYNTTS